MTWHSARAAVLAGGIIATLLGGPAAAIDCTAVALMDVPADEDPTSILSKGNTVDRITQYQVNKKTGAGVFCGRDVVDCYPRYLTVNGQKIIEAVRLENCKISMHSPYTLGNYIFYRIELDRTKISREETQYDEVESALLNMHMCSACASSAAVLYTEAPQSRCESLVARALGGDRDAITELQSDPSYCQDTPSSRAVDNAEVSPPKSAAPSAAPVAQSQPVVLSSPSVWITHPSTLLAKLGWLVGLIAVVGFAVYFLPSMAALSRRKRNALPIFVLNLFLGWTFLGWVGALVWSLLKEPLHTVRGA
jgi:hypothetical protein